MILAIFGTSTDSFERLLEGLELFHKKTGEKVIAQIGSTLNKNSIIECHEFIQNDLLKSLIKKSEAVVCQGGFGTVLDCISLDANVIAIPRSKEAKECNHNQTELLYKLSEQNKIVILKDLGEIDKAIELAKKLPHNNKVSKNLNIHIDKLIRSYLGD